MCTHVEYRHCMFCLMQAASGGSEDVPMPPASGDEQGAKVR